MTPKDHQRVSEVLAAVIGADPRDRSHILDSACGCDPMLRENVESLLRYHDQPAALLDDPSFWSDVGSQALGELRERCARPAAPDRIGRYRITGTLGEGGMGVVYLAEQDRPRRTVALKVMRSSAASGELLRRFEFEQQTLGRLQHSGIAQIFEAGVADDGQPFFAMEYIEGLPLTTFARARRLTVSQRLELMGQVCDAVQHAHQRGVIHRDLKPSNILVVGEGVGLAKILDFGVARAMGPDAQAATVQTDTGRMVGTLAYMSPEQFANDSSAIDARSDVYALGVILYELLTGRLPHDFSRAALHEAARMAHEQEPIKPGVVDRSLRGDIETIVLKALEKDVARRYQSAAQLADDIRRHQSGQPILARQDSSLYVLRKQLRRYRWAASAGVAFAVLLLVFAAYATMQSRRQRMLTIHEHEAGMAAQKAEAQATSARDSERRQRQTAEADTARAQSVTSFLVRTLGLTDPDVTQDANMTVEALLDQAAAEIGTELADQPEAEAIVRTAIGKAYATQGKLEQADAHFRRALEIRRRLTPEDVQSIYDILWPYWRVLSELDDPQAEATLQETLQVGRRIIAMAQPELAAALNNCMAEMKSKFDQKKADALFDQSAELAHQRLEPDDPSWLYVADQWHAAGYMLAPRIAPPAAARYLSAALEVLRGRVPETNTRFVRTMEWLVRAKINAGQHVEAERLVRQSMQSLERVLPADHWYVAVHEARLGECLIGQSKYAQAETLLLESHARLLKARGLANGAVIEALSDLVKMYDAWGRAPQAAARRLELARAMAGRPITCNMPQIELLINADHPELVEAMYRVRSCTGLTGDMAAALDEMLNLRHRSIANDHPSAACVADALYVWAGRHRDRGGSFEQSNRMYLEVHAIDQVGHYRHARKRADTLWCLAKGDAWANQLDQAEAYGREGLQLIESEPVKPVEYTALFESLLGGCLARNGRIEEAQPLLEQGYERFREMTGTSGPMTLDTVWELVDLFVQIGQFRPAEQFGMLAIERAMANGSDGVQMNRAAWRIARAPGFSRSAYERALQSVNRALSIEPANGNWLDTLGAVQYRLGRFPEALKTLTRAEELNSHSMPEDAAMLSLTCLGLQQPEQARKWQLHFLGMSQEPSSAFKRAQWQMLGREIESVLGQP